MKLTLATLTAAAVLAATPAYADVTACQYDRVQPGWTRQHVQRVFGDRGERVGMWASGQHRHLTKTYPAADGRTVTVEYVGPLCACGPYSGPYVVKSKEIR